MRSRVLASRALIHGTQLRDSSGQSRDHLEGSIPVGAASDLCGMVPAHGRIPGVVSIVGERPNYNGDAALHDLADPPRGRLAGGRPGVSHLSTGSYFSFGAGRLLDTKVLIDHGVTPFILLPCHATSSGFVFSSWMKMWRIPERPVGS